MKADFGTDYRCLHEPGRIPYGALLQAAKRDT